MILQTTTWICDVCRHYETQTEEHFPYSDPVIEPPAGQKWGYLGALGSEQHVCPTCLAAKTKETT